MKYPSLVELMDDSEEIRFREIERFEDRPEQMLLVETKPIFPVSGEPDEAGYKLKSASTKWHLLLREISDYLFGCKENVK